MKRSFPFFLLLASCLLLWSCKTNKTLIVVNSPAAPKVIGPYSHAIKAGNMVYSSGQIGLVPETGVLAGDDINSQTRQALKNLKAILEEAGSDMAHVVKVTVYLKDLGDYAKVNDIYKDYFADIKPARSAVQVAGLPKNALVEIECIAITK